MSPSSPNKRPTPFPHYYTTPTTMNTTDEAMRSVIQGPADVEWRYEMRRECQEILPNLYLGPFVASKSLDVLQSLKITHIVCIRDAKEAFSVRPRFPDRFHYMTLDVEDNEEQNLIRLFPGQVLALPHLSFNHHQLSWEDALHMVQNRRYCISPNGGFLTQIKEYEAIYKANVALAAFPQQNQQRGVARRKRSDDDDEDEARVEDRKRPLVQSYSQDDDAMQT
ncbi:hypothetical protein D9619_007045 [Psilocybe cf. subviscida]|uniref:Tyrosine-protein phosphatase domain-containing protein n=1 Tax=Psilocybe cf. subviscida TaxID=2480587 RepID=A0A8H5EX21_9AGAR|nr:hypothetical protein D9619_007045 [Psilocybe cf. subviscida]